MDDKTPFLARRGRSGWRGRSTRAVSVPASAAEVGVLSGRPPGDVRVPFRWWMTGSFAVALAALLPLRDPEVRASGVRVLHESRYGTADTVLRIEEAAAARGWSVLARVGGERPLLVLSAGADGTPVLMATEASEPVLPLGLVVRPYTTGAQVLVSAEAVDGWATALGAADVDALPALLRQALG